MAKKKNTSPAMSPDMRISDFIRFIISLPKREQKQMLEIMDMIESIPEDERNQVIRKFFLYSMLGGDLEDFEFNAEGADDEDVMYGDEFVYQYFLPRPDVRKYTLRVTLKGLKPAIYRKFNVPSNISLRHLSELLLELMGWSNEHLNQFRKGNGYYAPAYQREGEDDFMMGFGSVRNFNQEEYTLSDLLTEKGKSIEWEYDFGDSWLHEVKLSSIGDYAEGEPLVTFVKGERQCPPEDCGGIWGYQELLELLEKKKSHKRLGPEELDRLDWYCMDGDFDPEEFDTDFAHEICGGYCQ